MPDAGSNPRSADPIATSTAQGCGVPRPASPGAAIVSIDARRWWVLAVVTLAQLLVVANASVLHFGMPRIRQDPGLGADDVRWADRAYLLAFASLVLVGGRLADFARRRVVVPAAGLLGLVLASIVAGAAQDQSTLLVGRVLQGACGALIVPAALSILSTTFTDRTERAWALGVHGATAGAGAGLWVLLGGRVVEDVDWRWCLYGTGIGAACCAAGLVLVFAGRPAPAPPGGRGFDLSGALIAPAGLCLVLYAFVDAEDNGRFGGTAWLFVATGVAVLAGVRRIGPVVREPLLPKRIPLDRDRGAALLGLFAGAVSTTAVFAFVPSYLQLALDYRPSQIGPALLPMIVPLLLVAPLAAGVLVRRYGAKTVVPLGCGLSLAGFVFLYLLGPNSSYGDDVLPALVLIGVGSGLVLGPCVSAAGHGIRSADSGAAAGAVVTTQALGITLGISTLNLALAHPLSLPNRITSYPYDGNAAEITLLESYPTAFWWTGVLLALVLAGTARLFRPLSRAGEPDADEPHSAGPPPAKPHP
ncbi:MFS transporter, partial [Streptomyces sp. SID3343]|uniref:MFS transporter n=1 Tax=Streptomyces sp. SID3343 TaxID=2690260 RepID=UPI001F174D64